MHNAQISINKKFTYKKENNNKYAYKKKLSTKGKCFYCKKTGYLAQDYLDKPTLLAVRFSMLITKKSILE
jgi:hypothetical protein